MPATDQQNAWILRVLGVMAGEQRLATPANGAAASASLAELGLGVVDIWVSARDAFREATEAVNVQVSELQGALRDTYDPALQDIAELGLNALTRNTRVPLLTAIMEVGNGSPEQLKKSAPKLTNAIAAFRAVLTADPRIAACDNNPFAVQVAIVDTYAGALGQLEYAVSLAA